MHLAVPDVAAVSVAVPNYNYARYMNDRLGSIFGQSHPVDEVLVLDDCSTDDSATVISTVAAEWNREIRYIPNEANSGSVFAQWRKAAELSSGEFLWIAEADDLSEPDFLTRTLALMRDDPSVQLAFSDSRTVHVDGTPQWPSYKPYYATIEAGALTRTEIFEGATFVRRFLSVKNLILNVSATVWRRDALLRALDRCEPDLKTFRMAGDWRLYLEALALPGARIAYEARTLNVHRRHADSVTHALEADIHVAEIARCHAFAQRSFELPEIVAGVQADYLAEVAAQLGDTSPASQHADQADEPMRQERKRGRNAGARPASPRPRGC
jgi:glycosyltransferase involved in cell wall biosynthesis